MGSRRLNLFVILFVAGLLIGSGLIIASKRTVLGIDLRGGTQLVYEAQPTPANPTVEGEDIDRAIEIIRDRVDSLGVAEPEISRLGQSSIQVGLPDVQDTQRAVDQVGDTAQLYFYDLEPNVIPLDSGTDSVTAANLDQQSTPSLFDAVTLASEQPRECMDCTTSGPRYYLFDKDSDELVAGPEQDRADLFSLPEAEALPKGQRKIIVVKQGTIVVRDSLTSSGGRSSDSEAPEVDRYFVLRDRPALSGDDIRNPEQNFDPVTNQPNVTFDFTDNGRRIFQEVTRAIAERGLLNFPPQPESFAIVLDDEIVSRPVIDPEENPDGIDGRTGAQISGGFDITEAQDLAEFLRIGALPVELKLTSQSTVSATLGQQALDQGLKAGIVGLILVILFLIAYYRFLGSDRRAGAARLRGLLLRADEADPDHPYAAGHRRPDPDDRGRRRLEHRHLRADQGGGEARALDDQRDHHRLPQGDRDDHRRQRDHPADRVRPLRSRDRRRQGLRVHARRRRAGLAVHRGRLHPGGARHPGPDQAAQQPPPPRCGRAARPLALRLRRGQQVVLLDLGRDPGDQRDLVRDRAAQLRHRLRVRDPDQGGAVEPASVDEVRDALSQAGVAEPDAAKIQEVTEDARLGPATSSRSRARSTRIRSARSATKLESDFGLRRDGEHGRVGVRQQAVGPTFGEQVARSAAYAIIFSLILISAYVAFRFEAKYAIPVLIAMIHDILITAGVYSLSGREVSSATVAAFLTILGYSLYDTVIVFDRIRENVPRLPRATFSQIANRSLSEVLTRSLITGLSTVFLVTVILLFGGATPAGLRLRDDGRVLSGAYSSIFIASPVLTAWKQREPTYRAREARLMEEMGRVPTFPRRECRRGRHRLPDRAADQRGRPALPRRRRGRADDHR